LTSASQKKNGTITTYSGDRVDWARGAKTGTMQKSLSAWTTICFFFFFVVVVFWVPVLPKSLILYLSPIEEQIRQRSWPISIQSI